jgi:hypothetical protein
MHKIREGMGKRDGLYQWSEQIELDEGYFEQASLVQTNLKRRHGSQRPSNVAVMLESTPLEDIENGDISSPCRYFKMKALDTHKKSEINGVVIEYISENAVIFSDKSTSYVDFSQLVNAHITSKSDKEVTKQP